jgi:hypothetical protein
MVYHEIIIKWNDAYRRVANIIAFFLYQLWVIICVGQSHRISEIFTPSTNLLRYTSNQYQQHVHGEHDCPF